MCSTTRVLVPSTLDGPSILPLANRQSLAYNTASLWINWASQKGQQLALQEGIVAHCRQLPPAHHRPEAARAGDVAARW